MDLCILAAVAFGVIVGFATLVIWSCIELQIERLDARSQQQQLEIEDLYAGRERARQGLTPLSGKLQSTGQRERSTAGDRDSS